MAASSLLHFFGSLYSSFGCLFLFPQDFSLFLFAGTRRNGGICLPGIFRLHPGRHCVRRPLDKVRPIGIPVRHGDADIIFDGAVDFPDDVKHQEEQYGPENRVFTLEQNQKRYSKTDGEDKERRQKFKKPIFPLPSRSIIFPDYHSSRLHSRQTITIQCNIPVRTVICKPVSDSDGVRELQFP